MKIDYSADVAALQRVQAFWNTEACGTHFIREYSDQRDFFRKYREFRYRTEWHIPAFAAFDQARGKRVLEIGCGNGADGSMFAMHGARYFAVDLTSEAVRATREHFAAEGLEGDFRQDNAERLAFDDASFDMVYSFGVLHHTPHPEAAVAEVHRVLKPGGVAKIMLYHRHSFNYYVRILGYMRARVVLKALSRIGRWHSDRARLGSPALAGVRGNASAKVWELHYRNFLREGWSYLSAANFTHHCADGPECTYAYTYTKREAAALFSRFSTVHMRTAHLPLNKYPLARHLPRGFEKWCAEKMGWHLLIEAVK
jgi:2-polyprenyl-3-methyl-5-hydroxy-6-metoxy-1,4-benzoquinol methylase